jgi:murein DD-endopeptidase MepM/ murein hydrolase activator NlpD
MQRLRRLLKKAFVPVTVMVVPHSDVRPLRVKLPSVGILASIVMWAIGTVYVFSIAVDTLEYSKMKEKLGFYSSQFVELQSTIVSLKKAESEFKKIFSVNSREQILENLDTSDSGSVDMDELKKQIKITMESVGDIKDYLSQQRDLYVATPKGWPVDGRITSPYGQREHPMTGAREFHGGVDIAAEPGRPVRATADGIVSFAGWSGPNGNLVVLEHGFGFSTFYAHNKKVAVKTGQKVKRGDIVGYIGSTGNSTGPHVHYEVWRNGRSTNPQVFLQGRAS